VAKAVQMMISRRTVAWLRKIAQRRLPGTLVLLLAAVISAAASNCALPAKDADTVVLCATSYIGVQGTSSSVLFGVQKRNVQKPKVLEREPVLGLELVLLRNLRKQARMLNWNAQSVWSH
jgi:hypothetical protein